MNSFEKLHMQRAALVVAQWAAEQGVHEDNLGAFWESHVEKAMLELQKRDRALFEILLDKNSEESQCLRNLCAKKAYHQLRGEALLCN